MSAGHGQGAGGGLSSKSVTTDSSPSVLADVKGILDKRGKSEVSPEALLEADGNVNVAQASQDLRRSLGIGNHPAECASRRQLEQVLTDRTL